MSTLIALTRGISDDLARCELTHLARTPIDLGRARSQHGAYEDALRALGCEVVQLPAQAASPDCVFIEDTAVVLDALAVITRPGAESRRGECAAVADALSRWRELVRIEAPGRLDGGDVLVVGKTLHVGMSSRSDAAGADRLQTLLAPFGYAIRPVEMRGCLHLKSAVSTVDDETLLINPAWCHPGSFEGYRILEVDPAEAHAANVLRVDGTVIVPAAAPATRQRLEDAGIKTTTVPADELAKAEGGVTCCSLIFEA